MLSLRTAMQWQGLFRFSPGQFYLWYSFRNQESMMSTESSFRQRIRWGYVVSFLLLLGSYCLLFYAQQRQVKEAGWVIHSYTVVNKSEALKTRLTEAETAARGYVITQDSVFVKPYDDALQQIPALISELKELVTDNEAQVARMDTLDRLIGKRMNILTTGVKDFQRNNFAISEEWKQKPQQGLRTMDSIRLYVAQLNQAEQNLMNDRKKKLSDFFKVAKILAIVSLGIILIALPFSMITFNMENREKEKAVKRADRYKEDLESNKNVIMEKDQELKEFRDTEKFTTTGRIARTIAHEVRNPLTNILLATEQLKELENKSEETTVLLELINRNASRINQLVSDLLNATRFTHLDFETVEANQIVDESLEMAKDRIDLNKVVLQKNYSSDTFGISVDKEKMKVALLNVIVNAIEAIDDGVKGVLELQTRKDGNKCIIEISDNGKGIGEEELQKLFDPYFTTKLKGNGLGLTNTQSIILNHNGTIKVSSKPGAGTTFVILLDLAEGN